MKISFDLRGFVRSPGGHVYDSISYQQATAIIKRSHLNEGKKQGLWDTAV